MAKHTHLRNFASGTALVAGIIGVGVGVFMLQRVATAQQDMVEVPMFEVDPMWPKPLPGETLLGMTIGASVDAEDNLWVVHRGAPTLHNNEKGAQLNPPTADCCKAAAPVLAFNSKGDQIYAWGAPGAGYEWPESMHGVFVDSKGNVWLGGNGAKDAQILKFTKDGKFLAQSGHQGKNAGSNDPENFGRVAQIYIDPKTNEGYVADGYRNRRLTVIDGDTGKIKRCGAPTARSRTTASWGPTRRATRSRSSTAIPCTASRLRRTACFTFAIASMIASRSSTPTAPS